MRFLSWRSTAWRTAAAVSAIMLPIYLATMNRAIGFIDRGELAAVAATWGIPHSTGYPTLMLLAGAVVHVVPGRPVLVLNVLAAVLTAVGAGITTLVLDRVLQATAPALDERPRATLALLGALFLALTMTWWQQANGFEVYAFHCVLMPLVVWLGLRWIDAAHAAETSRKPAFAFGLVTGLALTNHLTTVLLAPGLVTFALLRLGPRRFAAQLPVLAPAFLLGLLPYVWLPIRSSMHPTLDWGSPHTLRGFVHHVSGADYRNLMFANVPHMAGQLRYQAWRIPNDFAWLGLLVAGLGAALLVRRNWRLALLTLLIAGTGAVFAAGFSISELDPYLLTSVLGLGVLLTVGLTRLYERFGSRVAYATGALLVVANGVLHWRACDERGLELAEGFARDLIGPLPRHAVLFTNDWGRAASPVWYLQSVEHVRTDVTLVVLDLLRVSWYLDELERHAPELVARARTEFDSYRRMVRDVEAGHPYRSALVVGAHRRFLNALARGAMADRPVFTTDALPDMDSSVHRVPFQLAFALRADTTYVTEPPWSYAYRAWYGRMDSDVAQTCQAYAESRVERAAYELERRHRDLVPPLVAAAVRFDPHIVPQQIGPLPLETDRAVLDAASYFRDVNRALRTVRRQPAGS